MSTFPVKCPQCGVILDADEKYIGTKAACAECDYHFILQKVEGNTDSYKDDSCSTLIPMMSMPQIIENDSLKSTPFKQVLSLIISPFKVKNVICKIFLVLYFLFILIITASFVTDPNKPRSDIFPLFIIYFWISSAFLLPAISIAQGQFAERDKHALSVSEKSWGISLTLAIFLGQFGIHRFYAGRKLTGFIHMLTLGGFGIGWITDIILIISKRFTDVNGNIIGGKNFSKNSGCSTQKMNMNENDITITETVNSIGKQKTADKNVSDKFVPNVSEKAKSTTKMFETQIENPVKQAIFADVIVPGNDEKNQAIPSSPDIGPGITFKITTKTASDNLDNFDFDSSYSIYSPYGKFMDDMKKYIHRTGQEVKFVPFMQYYPTYDSMTKKQKAWYFYWRTEARKRNYLNTDLSYIFVHVYEILNGCGWSNACDGYNQMINIWMAYREYFPVLDKYLTDWSLDFAILHKINHHIPENAEVSMPTQSPLRDMQIDKHQNDKPLKLPFSMVDILCDYSIRGSKFYKNGHQLLIEEALPRVVALADAALLKRTGKGILALYGPEKKKKQTYYAFRGAIYFESDKQTSVSVKPYTTTPQLRNYINEIVRYAENILREINDYRGRLRGVTLDEETAFLISSFLKKEYSVKTDDTTAYANREITLNVEKINKLRTESDAVRDALEVVENNVVNKPLLTDLEEVTALLNNLSFNAREFLFDLFSTGWSQKENLTEQLLVEEINKKANKYLAQTLLVRENNHYIVEDDYRDELEHIFINNPDIMKQTSNDSGKNISENLLPKNIYFSLEQLSVSLKDTVKAMTNIQQKVLYIIVTAEAVQEKLQTIADEEMTMPEILIDEINEIASQHIDDILIDTQEDCPHVFEQYEQDLKNSII